MKHNKLLANRVWMYISGVHIRGLNARIREPPEPLVNRDDCVCNNKWTPVPIHPPIIFQTEVNPING